MSTTIGDDTTPRYEFKWADGSSCTTGELRTTDELPEPEGDVSKTEAVETLAELGRDDPECDVTLLGFE